MVEFIPGECVDGAFDVRGGVVRACDVEVETAVGEFGSVGYGDGGCGGVDAAVGGLVEELGEGFEGVEEAGACGGC